MLKTVEILERFKEEDKTKYADMIKMVNIPDFYKTIAQFSGLNIKDVDDDTVVEYLNIWCKNKYRFFKMLGNKIRLDQKFMYKRPSEDISNVFDDLGKEYPAYALWLKEFRRLEKNKIDEQRLHYNIRDILHELFPQFSIDGSSLTHFFKAKLKADDEIVTKIGRIFENDTIEAIHTISIDPVDMMFASENPYNWQSCYRLELEREDSHADGCMAAILDSSSLITYVWEREGEYNMYDNYKFKKVRYYRMRQWIAISDDFVAIHFNSVYPGKCDYSDELEKQLRGIVEEVVSKYMGVANKWRKNDSIRINYESWGPDYEDLWKCDREFYYGYSEYNSSNIYINSEMSGEKIEEVDSREKINFRRIKVYDTKIVCPCGCGEYLIGSDECCDDCDEGYRYDGNGFIAENFYENQPEYKWCPYRDCECTCHCLEYDDCWEECEIYRDNNPVCSLDEYTECEDPDFDKVSHGQMPACKGHCQDCWMWEKHHPEETKQEKEDE